MKGLNTKVLISPNRRAFYFPVIYRIIYGKAWKEVAKGLNCLLMVFITFI